MRNDKLIVPSYDVNTNRQKNTPTINSKCILKQYKIKLIEGIIMKGEISLTNILYHKILQMSSSFGIF